MKKYLLLFLFFLKPLFCLSQLNISKIEFGMLMKNKELILSEFEVRNLKIEINDTTLIIDTEEPIILVKVGKFISITKSFVSIQSYFYKNKDSKLCLITIWIDGKTANNKIVIVQSITNYMVIYHIKMLIA